MSMLRKDTVKRMIERGELEARCSYSYDGRTIRSDTEFKPACMYDGKWESRKVGCLNFDEQLYSIWHTWRNPQNNSLITLQLADEYYELREIGL